MRTQSRSTGRAGARRWRICGAIVLAGIGLLGFSTGAKAEVCYLFRLTTVELNANGGPSDFAVPIGGNTFKITVKPEWPEDLMSYIKFTFTLLPGTSPAVMGVLNGGAKSSVKVDGNYASPFGGVQANKVSYKTAGWPTPDPNSTSWPNDYPNKVWLEAPNVDFQNCTVIRSQLATLVLEAAEIPGMEAPTATCKRGDCPPEALQKPGTVINPAIKKQIQTSP